MKLMRIRNALQALFFLRKGVKVSDVRFRSGGSYIEFIRDEYCDSVFTEWVERKH